VKGNTRKSESEVPHGPGYEEAGKAARYIHSHCTVRPRVGIILGSGLGSVLGGLRETGEIPYAKIPFFPRTSVAGHAGVLHLGNWGKVPVAVLEGRMHLYEGFRPAEVTFPTRVLARAGVETLIATCAAGGIARAAVPGSFMIFRDHLNYQGANPLVGSHDARWGERFVDVSLAYDERLRVEARRAARVCRVKCFEGVYVALLGPSYETPAEIRALRRLGADAVGMSTVPEVLAARQAGLRVLAIATISNRAAGLSRTKLSHQEVLSAGKKSGQDLARLLDTLMPRLAGK
jgi:purine-nucleoside phosphorylase